MPFESQYKSKFSPPIQRRKHPESALGTDNERDSFTNLDGELKAGASDTPANPPAHFSIPTARPAVAGTAELPFSMAQKKSLLNFDFAGVNNAAKENLEQLDRVANGSTHFHGSRSGSLVTFHTSTDEDIRGSLLPMGTLLDRNCGVFSGERGNSLHDGAFNRDHLSVVDKANYQQAFGYARDESRASSSSTLSRSPDVMAGFKSLAANVERLKKACAAQLEKLPPDSEIAHFVSTNFPVVYGLKPGAENLEKVDSSIPGEHGVKGGCNRNQIAAIFVPDEHVAAVTAYLQRNDAPKQVQPFSSIPLDREKPRMVFK